MRKRLTYEIWSFRDLLELCKINELKEPYEWIMMTGINGAIHSRSDVERINGAAGKLRQTYNHKGDEEGSRDPNSVRAKVLGKAFSKGKSVTITVLLSAQMSAAACTIYQT